MRRRVALVLAVVTASGVLALAAPGSAQAAETSCAGRKVRTLSFSTGSVQVYKRNGWICAITLAKRPGVERYMMVSVQARGLRAVVDEGMYSRLAGPRKTHAGQRKVRVKGAVGGGSVSSGWIRF
ncbi:hypothetical protein OHB06_19970 [Streptomyces sp. NBC_01604]|uniref:hypothetical protein n=1 Tax=Streptomyces sp. NBC_01604 TaxID=2975894 RepID=UPI00386CF1F6